MPVVALLVALGSGVVPYAALNAGGAMPLWLRDHPWPMELVAVAATVAAVALAVQAFRQRRVRIAATVSAVLGTLATAVFLLLIHKVTYDLPPPPADLAVGTTAPDFTLSDEGGHPVTLSSLRGHPAVLVFYRGFW
jgi:AhpC/TSA family protein